MHTDRLNRSFRFFGLLILLICCCLSADLRDAEAVTANVDAPAESKFSCMIAKSAYGSPSFDKPVRRLRQCRDQMLMGSASGRWVARVYYRLSGSLAPHLDGDGLSGSALRWTIRAFLYLVKYLEAIGLGTAVVLIAFVLGKGAIRVCIPRSPAGYSEDAPGRSRPRTRAIESHAGSGPSLKPEPTREESPAIPGNASLASPPSVESNW